jgi:hypothetical protein
MPDVLLTLIGVVNFMGQRLKETGMLLCRVFTSICLAAAFAAPSVSLAEAEITTQIEPPPLKVELAPPARDGYVWSAGHWEWSGRSYYWVSGSWVVQRRGSHYVGNSWEKVGAEWHFVRGHWER